MKPCTTCKYYKSNPNSNALCTKSGVAYINFRGEESYYYSICCLQRELGWILSRVFNKCGKEARWWGAKE